MSDILDIALGILGGSSGALALARVTIFKRVKMINETIAACAQNAKNLEKLQEIVDKNVAQTEALKSGLLGLLRFRLHKECEGYLLKGYCPVIERQVLRGIFEAYHALDGNGEIESLYYQVLALPISKLEG